jgi:inorganic phosphate transporter, PiT family
MWKLLSGILLGWSLGANHTGNVFGTGVATGTVTYRMAVLLTSLFVLLGAIVEGPKCMRIVGELTRLDPLDAFSCALAAGIMMTVLTFFAFPSSASQAVVGAVLGAGICYGTADFSKLYKIIVCWLFTPFCAIFCSVAFYHILRYLLDQTVKSVTRRNLIYAAGTLVTGCYGAYSLGANNVANVTGIYVGAGMLDPQLAAFIGGLSIVSGVLTYSKKVMMTIGKGIVPLDPFSALIAVLSGSFTLHLFTQIGVPVSSSQSIVGAVIGIGLVGDVQTVNLKMLLKIGIGWIASPISAAILSFLMVRLEVAETSFRMVLRLAEHIPILLY